MNHFKNVVALLIAIVVPFGLLLFMRFNEPSGFASRELILYPLLFGGAGIFIIWGLKRYYLDESLKEFNSGEGRLLTDVGWGIGLAAIYFILFYIERPLLGDILEFRSNEELLRLMLDMRENPWLLILWFLPVLWIGIALFEELMRVFMMVTLWKFSKSKSWQIIVIIISAIFIGLTHFTQGSYGMVTIGIKSLVAAYFFYRYRRLLPLVIAHVLYDGIQVGVLLITYPG